MWARNDGSATSAQASRRSEPPRRGKGPALALQSCWKELLVVPAAFCCLSCVRSASAGCELLWDVGAGQLWRALRVLASWTSGMELQREGKGGEPRGKRRRGEEKTEVCGVHLHRKELQEGSRRPWTGLGALCSVTASLQPQGFPPAHPPQTPGEPFRISLCQGISRSTLEPQRGSQGMEVGGWQRGSWNV